MTYKCEIWEIRAFYFTQGLHHGQHTSMVLSLQVRISHFTDMGFGGWHVQKVAYLYVTWHKNTQTFLKTNSSQPDWLQQKSYWHSNHPERLILIHVTWQAESTHNILHCTSLYMPAVTASAQLNNYLLQNNYLGLLNDTASTSHSTALFYHQSMIWGLCHSWDSSGQNIRGYC